MHLYMYSYALNVSRWIVNACKNGWITVSLFKFKNMNISLNTDFNSMTKPNAKHTVRLQGMIITLNEDLNSMT